MKSLPVVDYAHGIKEFVYLFVRVTGSGYVLPHVSQIMVNMQ